MAAPTSVKVAPSPWLNLPVSTYMLPFFSSPPLLDHAYAPLEAASAFASKESSGAFKGKLGMIQIVRYHDTPVGPYDELLVIPGYFEVPGTKRHMLRITRIYVSQKDTCWNGRMNWNIPKHMARFSFTSTGASTHIEVFPPSENSKRFFKAEIVPFKYIPALPFSTNLSKYVGMDLRLAQPPLPAAQPSERVHESPTGLESADEDELLCGTTAWKVAVPEMWGKAKCCWVNQASALKDEEAERRPLLSSEINSSSNARKDEVNDMWPAYKPWKIGLWMEDAKLNFTDGREDGIGE